MPKGIYYRTAERLAAISEVAKTDEARRKMSLAKLGQTPWNKGIPHTVETRAKMHAAAMGNHSNDGRYPSGFAIHGNRIWIRIVSGWARRAWIVWIMNYGPIPKGNIIHHADEDTTNDAIENLRCWTRGNHAKHHRALR